MYKDLVDKVYDRIRQMIISGELAPGQKLIQEDLAGDLGVSRTPLLQAISKLSRDKLVVSIPRRGAYVRPIDKKMLNDVYNVRCAIEPLGCELAASEIKDDEIATLANLLQEMEKAVASNEVNEYIKLDCTFHVSIMKASGNIYIYDIVKSFANTMLSKEMLLKTPQESLMEHNAIFSNLSRRDSMGAKAAMAYHLNDSSRIRLAKILNEQEQTNGSN